MIVILDNLYNLFRETFLLLFNYINKIRNSEFTIYLNHPVCVSLAVNIKNDTIVNFNLEIIISRYL